MDADLFDVLFHLFIESILVLVVELDYPRRQVWPEKMDALELELATSHMTQEPVLRGKEGMRI